MDSTQHGAVRPDKSIVGGVNARVRRLERNAVERRVFLFEVRDEIDVVSWSQVARPIIPPRSLSSCIRDSSIEKVASIGPL